MFILNTIISIGSINNNINMQDIAIKGMLSNLGYLILLIIINATTVPNINAIYGWNNPLRYNDAMINDIPGIGNPIKSVVSIFPAITLYLVSLKIPQETINKLTSITII